MELLNDRPDFFIAESNNTGGPKRGLTLYGKAERRKLLIYLQ
jgi:hypothetical protein